MMGNTLLEIKGISNDQELYNPNQNPALEIKMRDNSNYK